MIVTLPLSTPPALSVRNGPRELVIQGSSGGSVIAGLKRIRCPRDARKERPGAWQCVLLGRFRCAGRPWRCIPNVTRGERHPKRSSAPATHHPMGSVRGRGSEVTCRRGASVRIPIRALHRAAYALPRPVCEEGEAGLPHRPRLDLIEADQEGQSAQSDAPATQSSFSMRPGAWSEPRESGAGTFQSNAELLRPTRETLPRGDKRSSRLAGGVPPHHGSSAGGPESGGARHPHPVHRRV